MLLCINLEIGRGHPNYLDSFLKVYPRKTLLLKKEWKIMKRLYLFGGRGGICTKIYNRWRRKGKAPKFLLSLFRKDLERELKGAEVVMISHPILVQILQGRCKIFYLHGEIAAPEESLVSADQIFVPLPFTKEQFLKAGIPEERLLVSGLVMEPELVPIAEQSFQKRIKRLERGEKLTVAFFSSGAYPRVHIKKINQAVAEIEKFDIQVFLFSGNNRRLARYWEKRFPKAKIIFSWHREEENKKFAEILPELDCFVAPAHERTNWCCGLGLPLFSLLPHIGSYAPLNYQFAYSQGVTLPLAPENFGETILKLREGGKLQEMAEKGFGKFPIDGAKRIAEKVFTLLGDS
ncbi:MAG: hypothetical protein ABIK84_01665 [candidate division WOR-3 bacterium]